MQKMYSQRTFQSFYLENSSHFNSLNHQANLSTLSLHVYLAIIMIFHKNFKKKLPFGGYVPKNSCFFWSRRIHLTSFYMAPDWTLILQYLRKISHGASAQAIDWVPTRQLRHRYLENQTSPTRDA